MAISSNSVIHYTSKLENLTGIIKSRGFRVKYCVEEIEINQKKEFRSAIPMVCFCDIPLSEVKNHIDSYGSYGIGLYKSWAKKSELNPVLYLEENSSVSKVIGDLFAKLLSFGKDVNGVKMLLIEILQFCKNYEGKLRNGKIDVDNYRFYDEREWRFIPQNISATAPFILWATDYLSNKDEYNDKLKDTYLEFNHEDISYIIVDDESDIPEILKILNDVFEDTCTSKELKVLGTRIITKTQIFNDF